MIPQTRERIPRSAKEKAVETLHEITASLHHNRSAHGQLNASGELVASNGLVNGNTTKQRAASRPSYRPFAEQAHNSE